MIQVILDSPCTFNYISLLLLNRLSLIKRWNVRLACTFKLCFFGKYLTVHSNSLHEWCLLSRYFIFEKKNDSAMPSTAILLQ